MSASYSIFNYLLSSNIMPDLHSKIILSSKTVIISISLFTIYSSYSVTRFICVCSNCRISSFHFLTFPVRHPWLQLMPSFHLSINLICNCIVLGILVYSHFSSVTSFIQICSHSTLFSLK